VRLNRHTINRVAQLLRQRIVALAEQESWFTPARLRWTKVILVPGEYAANAGVERQAKPSSLG
jgi:hypothetical protein